MSGERLRGAPCGRFRLGDRWINPEANDIDGARVEAKSMDVLVALVEAAPSVVSGPALMDRVWPNVVVVDNVVYQAVAQLRKALGDDPHAPRYIENIPRRGYRLIAEIERGVPGIDLVGTAEVTKHDNTTPIVTEVESRKPTDLRVPRMAAIAAVVCLVAGLGFANRTGIGVWLALHVGPVISRPIDQQIGFATTSDGVRIAYATSGAGPPLVLVIGWFTHLKDGLLSPSYDSAGRLRWHSRDQLVVRYDGRGFGLSERNVTDFSLEARVHDLEAVVDALGLERFALCGLSAGGATAVTYADRHPERVSRLILLATWIGRGTSVVDAKAAERYAANRRMFEFARTDWEKPAARAAVAEWSHPKASEIERRVLMELYKAAGDGPAFANFASVVVDASEAARRIRVPTLVVAGSEDTQISLESVSRVAAAIPGSRFELVDGADHFEAIGNDARVMQIVTSFLAEDQP